MPVAQIELSKELEGFVEELVSRGEFASKSEVHQTALLVMKQAAEQREEKRAILMAEIQKGLDSLEAGRCIQLNSDEELEEFMNERVQNVIARRKA